MSRKILGAISIRYECAGIAGHSGFGIRPSERNKWYASQMRSLALPIMKSYGINPVVLSCAQNSIGSAKTILRNGGKFVEEVMEEETGETIFPMFLSQVLALISGMSRTYKAVLFIYGLYYGCSEDEGVLIYNKERNNGTIDLSYREPGRAMVI